MLASFVCGWAHIALHQILVYKMPFHSFRYSCTSLIAGLLRLQQIYQGLRPGNETFQVEMVKRIANVSMAIDFLRTLEDLNRWQPKYIVLDCPTDMAKEVVVNHVRDISLGRRTYHYLLSGLVSFLWLFVRVVVCGLVCSGSHSHYTHTNTHT